MTSLFKTIQKQYTQNLPFVVYNKPNSDELIGFFQKNDNLFLVNDFDEKGFVFAPFNGNEIILIPENHSEIITETISFPNSDFETNSTFKTDEQSKLIHQNLVQAGIDAINENLFNKVVLSRKEKIDFPEFDLTHLFQKLLNTYPSAFTYCWFHPKVGLWLGAFSEQLVNVENNTFKTMALAGTQTFSGTEEVIWQQKEKEEQQFVTDFILKNIEDNISNIKISSPYTIKAGNLLHIRTDISGKLNKGSDLKKLINVLHPTPAVCGFPKMEAKKFILENENYDREYYSGFLGELNRNNTTDLFVNLRCMQIKNNQVYLYMGGGITKDSIPEKEWLETVNKSSTMKRMIF
ncbi:MAG: isochorismate synthase [Flavobacterium sp.]